MVKQTAGRNSLGNFASKFAELNDDVLFGEVWSREDQLSLKTRSIITVTALISKGIVDSSLKYHLSTVLDAFIIYLRANSKSSAFRCFCRVAQNTPSHFCNKTTKMRGCILPISIYFSI